MSHEIITLQFGNYSNYIGTHYWNIQQSQFVYSSEINTKAIPDVNHDVLFREGLNSQKKSTYNPRVVLFDLKDNINEYKLEEGRNDVKKENIDTWKGDIQVFESEKKTISTYSIDKRLTEMEELNWDKSENESKSQTKKNYDMDNDVKYWSDYSNLKFNDKSYMLVNQYDTATIETEPFDLFNYGTNLFSENSFSDNFEDNIRHYAEECDNIQGFQFFVDSFNGFGGMSCKGLSLINEEYPKMPLFSFLSFPFNDTQNIDNNTLKLLNTSLTLQGLLTEKTENIIVPMSLFNSFYLSKELDPIKLTNVKYKPELEYHTSAILASLIDSITLPWRQKSQKSSMHDIVDLMDVYKYKIASVQSVFGLDIGEKYLFNYLQQNDLFKTSTWFTPFGAENYLKNDDTNISGAFTLTCRGVPTRLVKNPNDNYYLKGLVPANLILDQYSRDMYPKSRSKCFSIDTSLNVGLPYPNIFETNGQKKQDISLLTILQLNKSIFGLINFINNSVDKINLKRQTKYFENGFEYDDFLELKAFNRDLVDMYSA